MNSRHPVAVPASGRRPDQDTRSKPGGLVPVFRQFTAIGGPGPAGGGS